MVMMEYDLQPKATFSFNWFKFFKNKLARTAVVHVLIPQHV